MLLCLFVFVIFMVVRSGILFSKRFRLVAVAVVVVAVLAVAIILYDFSSGPSSGSSSPFSPSPTVSSKPSSVSVVGRLSNAGVVFVSEGSGYPGIVDLVGGSLNVTGGSVGVSVVVGDVVSGVGEGESVQWTVLLVLENQTVALRTYKVSLELNSSGFFGVWSDVASGEVVLCNASYVGSSLFAQANVDLGGATRIEWNVNSIYQSYSDGVLVAYASDAAPDVGFATLNLSS
jgi:hypothetical protein